jgi:hypothetical protein
MAEEQNCEMRRHLIFGPEIMKRNGSLEVKEYSRKQLRRK